MQVLIIFVTILACVLTIALSLKNKKKPGALLTVILVLGVVLFGLTDSFVVIPTGYTGIRTTYGQISQQTVPNGLNWKIPFIQDITIVNNKQQDVQLGANQIWGESSEKVQVYAADITVSYRLNPDRSAYLYANFRDIDNIITEGMLSTAVKQAMATLPATAVTQRGSIEPASKASLQQVADEKYGAGTISIIQLTIGDMNFEDSYNVGIAAKNQALLEQEQQAIINKTNIEAAEAEAEAARIRAQGAADAARIEAEGKAEANAIVDGSVTENTLRQDMLNKWDGQLPDAVLGEEGVMGVFDVTPDEEQQP